jgi:hypothetical protein
MKCMLIYLFTDHKAESGYRITNIYIRTETGPVWDVYTAAGGSTIRILPKDLDMVEHYLGAMKRLY